MSSARGGFQQGGVNVTEVLDLENSTSYFFVSRLFANSLMARLLTRIGAVFGETTVHGDAVSFKVLAKQLLTAAAVETLSAEFRVVSNNTVTDFETLDFGSNGSDFTNSFVA
jgi:hypothetical protein